MTSWRNAHTARAPTSGCASSSPSASASRAPTRVAARNTCSQPATPAPSVARASGGTSTRVRPDDGRGRELEPVVGIWRPRIGTTTSISSSAASPPASSSAIGARQAFVVHREVGRPLPQPAQEGYAGQLATLARLGRHGDRQLLEVGAGQAGGLDRGAARAERVELEQRGGVVADEALGQRDVLRQRRATPRTLRRRRESARPPSTSSRKRSAASRAIVFSASRTTRSRMPGRFAPARVPPALQTTLQEPAGLPAGKESGGGRYAAIGSRAAAAAQEPAAAVDAHVLDQGDEGAPLVGQRVLDPRRNLGIGAPLDDPLRPRARGGAARGSGG